MSDLFSEEIRQEEIQNKEKEEVRIKEEIEILVKMKEELRQSQRSED